MYLSLFINIHVTKTIDSVLVKRFVLISTRISIYINFWDYIRCYYIDYGGFPRFRVGAVVCGPLTYALLYRLSLTVTTAAAFPSVSLL